MMQTDVFTVAPSQAAIAPPAQEIKRKIKPNPAYQTQERLAETLKSKGPQVVEVFPGVFRWMSAEPQAAWTPYGSFGFRLYAGPYVCAQCRRSAPAVYQVASEFLCKSCREVPRGSDEGVQQPEIAVAAPVLRAEITEGGKAGTSAPVCP